MKLKEIFVLAQKEFEIQAMLTHFSHEHFKVCCVCMYAFFPEVQQAETSSPILIHIHTTESSVLGQNVTFLSILAAKDIHKKTIPKFTVQHIWQVTLDVKLYGPCVHMQNILER